MTEESGIRKWECGSRKKEQQGKIYHGKARICTEAKALKSKRREFP
jgi:hypothetical protein